MTRRQRAASFARHLIDKLAIREFWMFTIAAIALFVVGGIGFQAAVHGIPDGAGEIIAAIVTGLLLVARDVINAIRALWRVSQEAEEGAPPQ